MLITLPQITDFKLSSPIYARKIRNLLGRQIRDKGKGTENIVKENGEGSVFNPLLSKNYFGKLLMLYHKYNFYIFYTSDYNVVFINLYKNIIRILLLMQRITRW